MANVIEIIAKMHRVMPVPVKLILSKIRAGWSRHIGIKETNLLEQFPWTSPNVWEMIVSHYRNKTMPTVFEYGTGASSIWHIRNLIQQGGNYIGVEHDTDWFCRVLCALLELGIRQQLCIGCEEEFIEGKKCDASLVLRKMNRTECHVTLKLRPPVESNDPAQRYAEYVRAITDPCDVIIVDGRPRKACVNCVLDNHLIKPGGILVLMHAVRVKEGWLGYPALKGESDYQPEVNRMIDLGGKIVDGNGVDRWPGINRRSPMSVAYSYPCEACIVVINQGDR
ncbi:MAG: hypothetical protein ABIM30_02410 [candidate division WOR-3 bacterium]